VARHLRAKQTSWFHEQLLDVSQDGVPARSVASDTAREVCSAKQVAGALFKSDIHADGARDLVLAAKSSPRLAGFVDQLRENETALLGAQGQLAEKRRPKIQPRS